MAAGSGHRRPDVSRETLLAAEMNSSALRTCTWRVPADAQMPGVHHVPSGMLAV